MLSLAKIQIESICSGQNNFICNASNFASVLFNSMDGVNWVGFYLVHGDDMLLGPFHGNPACTVIPNGKGVCGAVAQSKTSLVVPDVHKFPGHIACDAASRSEIVVPMIKNDKFYGVLDIDSPFENRFGQADLDQLEFLLEVLLRNSDMDAIYLYYNR